MSDPEVAIIGAGGIGTAMAARLAEAGVNVVLVGRSAPHIEAIKVNGVILRAPGRPEERIMLRAVRGHTRGTGRARHVVIATKSFDTRSAADTARNWAGPDTWVATVQNGLGNDAILAAAFGAECVLPGLTTIGAERHSPGVVSVSPMTAEGRSLTQIGAPRAGNRQIDGAQELAGFLNRAGLPTEATDRIDEAIWAKLALAGMGPVCAILGVTAEVAWSHSDTRSLLEHLHDEAVEVAAAEGIDLNRDASWANAVRTYEGTGPHFPSMATDLRLGRPTEIDAITAAVAARGARRGVPTPHCDSVVALLRAADARRLSGV